jgi:hypothetical protein
MRMFFVQLRIVPLPVAAALSYASPAKRALLRRASASCALARAALVLPAATLQLSSYMANPRLAVRSAPTRLPAVRDPRLTRAPRVQEPPRPLGSLARAAGKLHASATAPSRSPPPVAAAGTRAVPGRNKVMLEKGFSQVDWMGLTRTHPDLAGARRCRARVARPSPQRSRRSAALTLRRGSDGKCLMLLSFSYVLLIKGVYEQSILDNTASNELKEWARRFSHIVESGDINARLKPRFNLNET